MSSNLGTITMTANSTPQEPDRVCPCCGHVGKMATFRLPSPEFCQQMVNGMPSAFYRVNVGTESAPQYVQFAQTPTQEQIAQAVTDAAHAKKTAAQAQSKRKE